jgi:hypothetical protein
MFVDPSDRHLGLIIVLQIWRDQCLGVAGVHRYLRQRWGPGRGGCFGAKMLVRRWWIYHSSPNSSMRCGGSWSKATRGRPPVSVEWGGQLTNGSVDRSVLPVNRWARHVRVNECERPSSLHDTSALQVGPNGQIQCKSAGIDRLVQIAKNLRYTCDILRLKRKPAVFQNFVGGRWIRRMQVHVGLVLYFFIL